MVGPGSGLTRTLWPRTLGCDPNRSRTVDGGAVARPGRLQLWSGWRITTLGPWRDLRGREHVDDQSVRGRRSEAFSYVALTCSLGTGFKSTSRGT